MIPTLHIHLLGDFHLLSGDTAVTPVTIPRVQSLLAYLVLRRSAPQARSHLAFLLWPESTEAQARTNLRKVLHQLKQTLPFADTFLRADKQSLHWQFSPHTSWTLDVIDFELALVQAEQAKETCDVTAMRQALERAIHLYQDDLLPSCYDEWILPERDRLRQIYLQALHQVIMLHEQERNYDEAINMTQRLLRHDPLHEAAYRQLMHLYALQGNRAAALRVYHSCTTILERELAAEPDEATRLIYQSLLQVSAPLQLRSGSPSYRSVETSLVGRKQEWGQLQRTWHKVACGHPQVILLTGEAGIGKTRLAEEMEAWVSRQGRATASARCYASEGQLPYAPVTTWLRADAMQQNLSALADVWLTPVARLIPDLLTQRPDLPHPTPITEGWQRQQFFEALARALLIAGQPLLLLLDDMQWCDNETLEWVHYLLRFEPGACLLLIGTARLEEILPGHPLLTFLDALRREDLLTDIALKPLDTGETTSLAEHLVNASLDQAMSATLYQETEGNPLFIVEMLRTGNMEQYRREPNSTNIMDSLFPTHLPAMIQTVLATRLAQLSPLAHELANVAAVIGREFSFAVLERASGKDEEASVQGLDELWQRRIVREQGGDAYDFSHGKLREQAYTSLSAVRRRLLHRRVAEALIAVCGDTLDSVSRQIAVHYESAGLSWQAITWYQRAGDAACSIAAIAQAIDAYRRAVAIIEANAATRAQHDYQWVVAVQIYISLGDQFEIIGRMQDARQAYQQGWISVPEQAPLWQARVQRRIAKTWNHPSTLETLLQGYEKAADLLEQAPDRSNDEWRQEWLDIHLDQILPLQVHRLSVQEMTAVIEKMRPIMEQYGTEVQRAQFFLCAAARNMARERVRVSEETIAQFRSALQAIQRTRNSSFIGFARYGLGRALFSADQLDEAEEQIYLAMNIGEEIGHVFLLERCLSFLPFIFRQRGRVEEVRQVMTYALAMQGMRQTGMLAAHHSWLAWRDEKMDTAEEYGKAALAEWQCQRQANPHRWTALWPLIGVMLLQERLSEAIHYMRMLLLPPEQHMQEELKNLLETALLEWEAERHAQVYLLLQRAVPLAQEKGYL